MLVETTGLKIDVRATATPKNLILFHAMLRNKQPKGKHKH